jgi:hypothetical protein
LFGHLNSLLIVTCISRRQYAAWFKIPLKGKVNSISNGAPLRYRTIETTLTQAPTTASVCELAQTSLFRAERDQRTPGTTSGPVAIKYSVEG